MPVQFINKGKRFDDPTATKSRPANALVVCAGTVHLDDVNDMGSGFNVFKSIFGWKNPPNPPPPHLPLTQQPTWAQNLDADLKESKANPNAPIPHYKTVASAGNQIGGIATVPIYDASDSTATMADKEAQYKEAVKMAVREAQIKNIPLYIQPLGTGAYGWPPEHAGELFAQAISEADPKNEVDIQIPFANARFANSLEHFLPIYKNAPQPVSPTPPPAPPPALKFDKKGIRVAPYAAAAKPDKTWQAIIQDYDSNYKNKHVDEKGVNPFYKKELTPDGRMSLGFKDEADAKDFFEAQQKKGHTFFAKDANKSFSQGCHFYSCGDGQLYKGTPAKILADMQAEIAKNNPTAALTQSSMQAFKQQMLKEENIENKARLTMGGASSPMNPSTGRLESPGDTPHGGAAAAAAAAAGDPLLHSRR